MHVLGGKLEGVKTVLSDIILILRMLGLLLNKKYSLDKLIAVCKKNRVFTIADEVMTGFGKTGKTFACNYLNEQPDMMCLSKALTAGAIPMALTTFTQEIFDGFLDADVNKALFHGHTFTANPTGCAAALAGLSLLESDEMQANIQRIHQKHLAFQSQIAQHSKVKITRVLGVIFALEIKTDNTESYYGNLRNKLYHFFIENGIILRPVGNIVYILPPYVITDPQLDKVYQIVERAIEMV